MIAYSDLVAALRHWRARNGLPNFGTEPVGPPPDVAFRSSSGPPGPPPGSPLRATPPVAPAATIEVEDEIEAHEIESEEIYDNEGGDFALQLGGEAPDPAAQGIVPGYGTDPGADASKFPSSTGYTDPGVTDPDKFGTGTATFDDDFVAESSPAAVPREGTKPGIGSLDADTDDQTLPPAPPPGKKKKKR